MRQLMRHDLQYGIKHQWKTYLAGCIMVLFACRYFQNRILDSFRYGSIGSTKGSVMDYLLSVFKGLERYSLTENGVFRIPTIWISIYIILAYLVGYYAEKDLKSYGMYSLLAVKSRTKWWISKCLWCIGSVTLFYLLMWCSIALYVGMTDGILSLSKTADVSLAIQSCVIYLKNDYTTVIMVMGLPLLMACALSLLQMFCSLLFGSVVSFAGLCCLYIISLYYSTPISPVNYLMWIRNDVIITENGCNTLVGIFLALIIMLVSMLAGVIYMDRYDMLSKQ